MARDKQTIILESIRSIKNGRPTSEACEKAIDAFMKETFTGLSDEEILLKIKEMLWKQ